MELILDTNFLVSSVKFGIDFFEALGNLEEKVGKINVYIPLFCVQELHSIMKDVEEAKISLELLNQSRIKILDVEKSGKIDDSILEYATEKGYAVATNDKELIKKLKERNLAVVRIRQMKYFEVD